MNKFTFAALATSILAAASVKAGYQDFVLVNNTENAIFSVYVSPSGSTDWEEDILGDGALDCDESLSVTINGRTERFWDLRIVYFDSKPDAEFYGLDLGRVSAVILNDNSSGGTTITSVTATVPAVNPAPVRPMPRPIFTPSLPMPGPSPIINQSGSRICPSCHGTGSCSICHGVGFTTGYGARVSCDTKCSSCGGTGRY